MILNPRIIKDRSVFNPGDPTRWNTDQSILTADGPAWVALVLVLVLVLENLVGPDLGKSLLTHDNASNRQTCHSENTPPIEHEHDLKKLHHLVRSIR